MGDVPEFESNDEYGLQCQDCGDWTADPVVRCRECDSSRDADLIRQGMNANGV